MPTTYDLILSLKHLCKSRAQIQQIHAHAITTGLFSLDPSPLLKNILHSFASSSSSSPSTYDLTYSTNVFTLMPNPSNSSYNDIIRAHTLLHSPRSAFTFFLQMRRRPIAPNAHTFPFVLKACGLLQNSHSLAMALHAQLTKFGFSDDVYVCGALCCTYARSGDVHGAEAVFDGSSVRDAGSYSAMIDVFLKAQEFHRAKKLFDEMPHSFRTVVIYTAMINGLCKAGDINCARDLFHEMPISIRNGVTYSAMIDGLFKAGDINCARDLFHEMPISFRNGVTYSAMIDGFCKAGQINCARELFDEMPISFRDVVSYSAMLMGLAMHGHGGSMLEQYFSRMLEDGVKPDGVTILAILVGCSHSGLINDAKRIFMEMESVYGVPREIQHYGCMVDLLSRAGLIKEAREFIEGMQMEGESYAYAWGTLLGGCKTYGDVEVAEEAARHLRLAKPEDGAVFSSLAHIYANLGQWDEVAKVQRLRGYPGVKKRRGCCTIELDGITHKFFPGGDCSKEICLVSKDLHLQLAFTN